MTPTISIVTSTLNAEETVGDCLDSVAAQTVDVEHLLIDGGSTDRTVAIAEGYASLARIVSEPDRGFYDAINKGIRMAQGDVIGILNSDDVYQSPIVLEAVLREFQNPEVDAVYGDLVYTDRNDLSKVTRYWKAGRLHSNSFLWGWMPPHPTFFLRAKAYRDYGYYDLSLGSAADYELMLRMLVRHRVKVVYIPSIQVRMRVGGSSNRSLRNRIRANLMDRRAWYVNGMSPYPWTTFIKPLRKIQQYFRRPS